MDRKIETAKNIARRIIQEKERLLVEDNGVIVQNDGFIVDWFEEIVSEVSSTNFLAFCIASKFRPRKSINHRNPAFYVTHIFELDRTERTGLLVRYTKFKNIELSQSDYSFFADLLTGFPEQVFFTVDLIEDLGIYETKNKAFTIQQYSSDRAKIILDNFVHDGKILNFIYLLSKFEFVSYETLFSIVEEKSYSRILELLLNSAICERLGSSGAYIRVNDVIRDYISRNRFNLPNVFDNAIKSHVEAFVKNFDDDSTDLSDYIFSAQEAVLRGMPVDEHLIIPSILIKTVKKLYDEDRNYPDAITLCDRVLCREGSLHKNTVSFIRFIKCQCLARLRNKTFFAEVKFVSEPERSFLYGFYYRISGELAKAEENFNRVLSFNSRDPRAIGELVLIYLQTDEFDLAFDLAKDNYFNRPSSPINAFNYFNCLIHKEKNDTNKKELEAVIRRLSIDSSDIAQEMVLSCKARLLAYYDHEFDEAFKLTEQAMERFSDVVYPCLTKAELAVNSENIDKLREAVLSLEKFTKRKAQTYRTFIKYKVLLMACEGDIRSATKLISEELSGLSSSSKKKIIGRVEYLADRFKKDV